MREPAERIPGQISPSWPSLRLHEESPTRDNETETAWHFQTCTFNSRVTFRDEVNAVDDSLFRVVAVGYRSAIGCPVGGDLGSKSANRVELRGAKRCSVVAPGAQHFCQLRYRGLASVWQRWLGWRNRRRVSERIWLWWRRRIERVTGFSRDAR